MTELDMKLDKWIRWMKIIHDEIQSLVITKNIFWSVQNIIKENPEIHKPTVFYWYLGHTYAATALIGIRRQAKFQKDSISFARLLGEIAAEPEKISREYYKELYDNNLKHRADEFFDRFCDNSGDAHISAKMVQKDIAELERTAKICADFADERVAHWDKTNQTTVPKFGELDQAIEVLHKLYLKYHMILHAEGIVTLQPTYQYNWQEVFNYPWKPQSDYILPRPFEVETTVH
jgi:hypothetical protein